ncbi:pseudaminic acid cytidylyltransferase [Providencia sp.]|uniref:pseudaminic acid cytidylyltransferase n=1 Tax=Providencia sp. TaxID=589 RepID=UPI003F95012E
MNIAIIPARGGSKRIPRKNIKDFNGKPIIAYSIEAAKNSGCFDKIIVSTDDKEIAEISRALGAETPFIRPQELSDDYTNTGEVIAHAIEYYINLGEKIDYVCCIYATAPLISTNDIKLGYQKISSDPTLNYCFPVCEFPFPIQRGIKLTENNKVEMFHPENYAKRSQDLEKSYHDAGQFYWGRPNAYLSIIPTFSNNSVALIIPRKRVVDLDTEEDWEIALMLSNFLNKS